MKTWAAHFRLEKNVPSPKKESYKVINNYGGTSRYMKLNNP